MSIRNRLFIQNQLFKKPNTVLSCNILEVKPKAVYGEQTVINGATQDGNNAKSTEGPMDKVSTMLPTVWFGAQSGRSVHRSIEKLF